MLRHILATTVATAALLGAGAAHAGGHWSVGIGINLPAAGVVVAPEPVYVEPAPVYYAPPPPVVYAPPPPRYVYRDVYVAPAPRVVYETTYRSRRWDDRWDGRRDDWQWRREHERHERWEHHDRDGYGPYRGR
jgi:hypothetical protein